MQQQQLVGVVNLLFTAGQAGTRAPGSQHQSGLTLRLWQKNNHGAAKLAMANATKRAVRSVLIEPVICQDHVEAILSYCCPCMVFPHISMSCQVSI